MQPAPQPAAAWPGTTAGPGPSGASCHHGRKPRGLLGAGAKKDFTANSHPARSQPAGSPGSGRCWKPIGCRPHVLAATPPKDHPGAAPARPPLAHTHRLSAHSHSGTSAHTLPSSPPRTWTKQESERSDCRSTKLDVSGQPGSPRGPPRAGRPSAVQLTPRLGHRQLRVGANTRIALIPYRPFLGTQRPRKRLPSPHVHQEPSPCSGRSAFRDERALCPWSTHAQTNRRAQRSSDGRGV